MEHEHRRTRELKKKWLVVFFTLLGKQQQKFFSGLATKSGGPGY